MARRVGPWHDWFAWRPVRTDDFGWQWCRKLRRRRCRAGYEVTGAFVVEAVYWQYTRPGYEW